MQSSILHRPIWTSDCYCLSSLLSSPLSQVGILYLSFATVVSASSARLSTIKRSYHSLSRHFWLFQSAFLACSDVLTEVLLSEPATAQTKSLRSRKTKTNNVQCANQELERFQVEFDQSVCVLCVMLSLDPSIQHVRLVDVPAGITQEEGHTQFLFHLPSVVLA